jgi:hypothetical protein
MSHDRYNIALPPVSILYTEKDATLNAELGMGPRTRLDEVLNLATTDTCTTYMRA